VPYTFIKKSFVSQAWWLMAVILATKEAEIGSIMVLGQPEQKSSRDTPPHTQKPIKAGHSGMYLSS
jgi:hypothetical protein